MRLLDIVEFLDRHLFVVILTLILIIAIIIVILVFILALYANKQGRAVKFFWIEIGARSDLPSKDAPDYQGNHPQNTCIGIHHVSLPVKDLAKSHEFYKSVLGLKFLKRDKAFEKLFPGKWYQLPTGQQIHLTQDTNAPYRERTLDFGGEVPPPVHFAMHLSSENFVKIRNKLMQDQDILCAEKRYPVSIGQLYILDPDNYIIELTDAGLK